MAKLSNLLAVFILALMATAVLAFIAWSGLSILFWTALDFSFLNTWFSIRLWLITSAALAVYITFLDEDPTHDR